VDLDGPRGPTEDDPDLRVRLSLGDPPQDLMLARGERMPAQRLVHRVALLLDQEDDLVRVGGQQWPDHQPSAVPLDEERYATPRMPRLLQRGEEGGREPSIVERPDIRGDQLSSVLGHELDDAEATDDEDGIGPSTRARPATINSVFLGLVLRV